MCLLGTVSGLAVWEHRLGADLFDPLARFGRAIVHDPRGTGGSDPLAPGRPATAEGQAEDVVAVLDDASIEKAFLFGTHAGGGVGVAMASAYPDRVSGLLLVNSWARLIEDEEYPGISRSYSDELIEAHSDQWGTGMFADAFVPSRAGDPEIKEFFATIEQHGSSRAQAVLLTRMAQELDVRKLLAGISVPTVVMHSEQNTAIPASYGRYLAEHIPGARYIGFDGTDHLFQLENPQPVLVELETLVTGRPPDPAPDRVLATVLFTDIVGSTERIATIGDRNWRELVTLHHAAVRDELDRFRGREIDTAGDGFLAVFDAPARAIRCAQAITLEVRALGLEIRAGVHTGECERLGDKLGGIGVHIGARIAALAGPTEVLVSSTVKELAAGSGLRFVDRGIHTLKGVPDEWRLFAVVP